MILSVPKKTKKPTKKTSERKAAAARENGKKGGRPRKDSLRGSEVDPEYQEIFGELLAVPDTDDPIVMAVAAQKLMYRAAALTAIGKGNRERNQELRAFCNSIQRMIPLTRQLQAERALARAATPEKPGKSRGSRARRVTVPKKRSTKKKPTKPTGPIRG